VRTDLIRTWLAHPASLARVGYDGFATSAPGADSPGYVALGAGVRDPWEPAELGTLVPDHPTQHEHRATPSEREDRA
jgi:hypothetical protein